MNYGESLRASALLELRRRSTGTAYWQGARPNQRPPDDDWRIWLIMAGRGFGKTRTIVEWAQWMAHKYPGSRGGIAGATADDVRAILIDGESGFLNVADEGKRPRHIGSQLKLEWANGTTANVLTADKPDRFRGKQYHWAIADELAAWRYPEAWDQLLLGLRLGDNPRIAVATTPKPTKLIRGLLKDKTCHTTRGTTYENRDNLAPAFFKQIITRYEGTRLGRQELNAEVLDDVEGALWNYKMLDDGRVSQDGLPDMVRIVVGVDPKVSVEAESRTGIVVVGRAGDGQLYVLEDASIDASPDTWGRCVSQMYHKWDADRVVAEVNQGGDMVTSVLRTIDSNLSIRAVRATKGKYVRAEPVAALYEQGKAHHVGMFSTLEEQMCSWVPGDESPDNMDALVWACTDLMTQANVTVMDNPFYQ
jgi:phage terminase large subunit-like protein